MMGVPLVGWPSEAACLTSAQVDALLMADVVVADEGFEPPARERFVRAGAEWMAVGNEVEALQILSEEAAGGRAVVRVVPAHRLVAAWRESARVAAGGGPYTPVAGMRPLDVQLARWQLPSAALARDAWAADEEVLGSERVTWVDAEQEPATAFGEGPPDAHLELVHPHGEKVYAGPLAAVPATVWPDPLLAHWQPRAALRRPRVLILRADGQAGPLGDAVRREGWIPVLSPILAFESPNWSTVDDRLTHLDRYAWVVFTSANGVAAFFGRLRFLGQDVRRLTGRVAAVGQETCRRLGELCLTVDLVPTGESSQEGLLAAFGAVSHLAGQNVLLVVGDRRGATLATGLRAGGVLVNEVVVYRTVPRPLDEDVRRDLVANRLDAVLFTSGSTAQFLWAALGVRERAALGRLARVSIGSSTSRALERLGLPPTSVAARPDTPSLVEALRAALAEGEAGRRGAGA
ncbi:MAG: uroporphyrinogen-III synthase [Thermaerobacter sp.]|nr:uroporphyrinogen-III synthase [Thermaerobacter sp.]